MKWNNIWVELIDDRVWCRETYTFGTQFVVINISYLLSTPIAAYVFLPVFYRLQSASVYKSVIIASNSGVILGEGGPSLDVYRNSHRNAFTCFPLKSSGSFFLCSIVCSAHTLVLKHCQAKKNGPLMGQVFLDSSDQCGCGRGWQNLRKWEKARPGVQQCQAQGLVFWPWLGSR